MSIINDIHQANKGLVTSVTVNKHADLNGESATEVEVLLTNGYAVTGTFTNEARKGFGGVEFESKKDIPALMSAKIKSVLEGTHERS